MTKSQKISVMLQLAAISKMLETDRQQEQSWEDWIEDFQQFQADVNEFKEEK